MVRILWLDDEIDKLKAWADALRAAGHDVITASEDHAAIQHLKGEPPPALFIQDLYRPNGLSKRGAVESKGSRLAGWVFHQDVLGPQFPQIPVIIYSASAARETTYAKLEQINVRMVNKSWGLERLIEVVAEELAKERIEFHSTLLKPGVHTLDLDKVNLSLIRHLAKKPEDMHHVSWMTFEHLVQQILKELGYEVWRTKLTRDGGVDLWAMRSTELGDTLYAIDAKKYSPKRLVAPSAVRAIFGVADQHDATGGMIVTTSAFGPSAYEFAKQLRFRVSLKDYYSVTAWLRAIAGTD